MYKIIKARILAILKKRALHQTAFVTFGSLVNGVSLFALNIILARSLSRDFFGIFSMAVLALSTAGELSDFGLNSGLLRFAPFYIASNQLDKLKQLVKTIWQWRVSLSWILTIGGIVLAYPLARYLFGQPVLSPYLAFASLGIGGVVLLGFLATYLQAKQRFVYNSALQSLKGFLRLVFVFVFMIFGITNIYAYLAVYIFVPWALFLLNFYVLPAKFWQVKVDEDVKKSLHSQLARFSFWLTLASLISIAAGKIDQVMVSHYLGLAEAAVFTVAWQLIQLFPVIYGSITSVLMPKISGLQDKVALSAFIRRTFKWTFVGAIGIGLLIYPSQYLIHFLFGQKYDAAMPVYLILAYGMLLNVVSIPFSITITAFNRTQIVALSAVVQLVLVVALNVLLIPRYGIMGSAYTFAVSIAVQFVWSVVWAIYFIRKKELIIV